MGRFRGSRIIIIEGLPQAGTSQLAQEFVHQLPGASLYEFPLNPEERPPNLHEVAREILFDNFQKATVLVNLLVPERLFGNTPRSNLDKFEQYLSQLQSYQFFLRGSAAFFERRTKDIQKALKLYNLQSKFEQVYRDSGHPHRLYLGADTNPLPKLVETIMFQSDILLRPLESEGEADV